MRKRALLLLFILTITISLFGCGFINANVTSSVQGMYFDTFIDIKITSTGHPYTDAESSCKELLEYYDSLLSKTNESSDIYRINANPSTDVEVSDETIYLINKALYYEELSQGEFTCTIGSLSNLWDFKSDNPKVPDALDIQNNLNFIGKEHIHINNNTVSVDEGCQLDLGGIAKGYVADKLKECLLEYNIDYAIINLGGNVLCVNKNTDKSFNIGIQKPFSEDGTVINSVSVKDKSVVTSGSYQRYFYDESSNLYHHILDVNTGYPVKSALNSVTIISDSSLDGDALSTICFIYGKEKGLRLIESLDNIEAIFIDDSNTIYTSSGIDLNE